MHYLLICILDSGKRQQASELQLLSLHVCHTNKKLQHRDELLWKVIPLK